MSTSRQVCTFILDGYLIGLNTQDVREVLRSQDMTRVPLAPTAVSGLINLRGEIVIAIDLRLRLELDPRTGDHLPMNVVVTNNGVTVSLLVDEIGDVIDVSEDTYEPAPEHLEGVWHDLIYGTYKLEDRLLLMLDLAETIDLADTTGRETTAVANTIAQPHCGDNP